MKQLYLVIPTIRQGGGAAKVFLNLINNLSRNFFYITLVVNKMENYNMPILPNDIKIIDLNVAQSRYAIFKLIKLIVKDKPDIVFSTMGYMNLLIAIVRPLLPKYIRFVARETNTVSIKNKFQPHPKLFDWLYTKFYKNLDTIIAQSEYMKNDLIKNYNIKEANIKVINNPVDISSINKKLMSKLDCYQNNKINLLAVGRFNSQKGYDSLIYAFSKLSEKYILNIIGDGKEKENIKLLAKEINIIKRVNFLGFQDNPYAFMKQADLFILSSRYEGFPNVVLEANACGTPVVAFDCPGGTKEIIVDGFNGLMAKCQNIDDLAQKIEEAISAEFDQVEIIENIKTKYGLQNIIKQYENSLC